MSNKEGIDKEAEEKQKSDELKKKDKEERKRQGEVITLKKKLQEALDTKRLAEEARKLKQMELDKMAEEKTENAKKLRKLELDKLAEDAKKLVEQKVKVKMWQLYEQELVLHILFVPVCSLQCCFSAVYLLGMPDLRAIFTQERDERAFREKQQNGAAGGASAPSSTLPPFWQVAILPDSNR